MDAGETVCKQVWIEIEKRFLAEVNVAQSPSLALATQQVQLIELEAHA